MNVGEAMLERKEAVAQRGGKVVEKIAGLMEARARGEDIRLEELFALIDGCRDELSAEEIARWKRELEEDYNKSEAPTAKVITLRPKPLWRPTKHQQKTETDEEPPKVEAAPEVFSRTQTQAHQKSASKAIADLASKEAVKGPLIQELAEVFLSDDSEERLRYNTQKAEVAAILGVTQMDVHRAVKHKIEKDKEPPKKELTQAQKAVALSFDDRIQLWSDPTDGTAYASVRVGKHWENHRIGSLDFESWVRAEYGARHSVEVNGRRVPVPISNQALHEAIAMMKAQALAHGARATPSLRIGGNAVEVWLDLGAKDWELIKINEEGWELFTEGAPGVGFVRRRGMLELPQPEQNEDIQELRKFLNVGEEDFVLQVGWLLGAFRYRGPYPVNMLTGVAGAAKTSACRVLQRLIDPNFADLVPLKEPDDIYVNAYNRFVLGFDNISFITADQADAICRISTGTVYAKRALRTDADQFMMQVCRPILLNGIPDDLADRGDLADRSIVTELPALDEETQLSDEEFWEMFDEARPRLLGTLLNGVVGAMHSAGQVRLDGYGRIRMIDFARWAEAGCQHWVLRKVNFSPLLSPIKNVQCELLSNKTWLHKQLHC
jgi:hypothetical protein